MIEFRAQTGPRLIFYIIFILLLYVCDRVYVLPRVDYNIRTRYTDRNTKFGQMCIKVTRNARECPATGFFGQVSFTILLK